LKWYGLNELREMFLAFFEEKEHLRLPSFPLIPRNDASLLLINSGMAPMKTWFTGEQDPPRKRICTCQKCIRTGDIDSVGKTSRHGTYFEMLGNFSFGDYFKEDAIVWCWEFLTERLCLDKNLLTPSVYVEDETAFNIWRDVVGIDSERIVKLGKDDNFWDHGSGPCGPCSEVYFDRGAQYGCDDPKCAPGCDCDRFIEIWNNVFTQFNNDGSGNYSELSQKNIDTGLGLERLACVCQSVSNMFEVDTIVKIVNKVSEISGVVYGKDANSDSSIRIITDHMRAAAMMICDGVLPSNEGRGYVLRRLLRRAARHGRLLGIDGEFLCGVCEVVISENISAYPDLAEKTGFILRVIQTEEESFGRTIDAGITLLHGFIQNLKSSGKTVLSGADTFKLYDTYGFPLDLTVDILKEHKMTADIDTFNEQMEAQRSRARKAREALGDLAWDRIDLGLDNTPTAFVGFERHTAESSILAIVTQGEIASSLRDGDDGIIVLDKTPFYAEKGGQSADNGSISADNAVFEVSNVQETGGGKYLHYGKMKSGALSVNDRVSACINSERRAAIMRAHTATHLLQEALRSVLGEHINQAGSLVEPDKVRFDFTHFAALTQDELEKTQSLVNAAILKGFDVEITQMSIDEAKKRGATALFGEKYSDVVRVVKMGDSIELCGGTHLDSTAKAGAFSIVSEFSVASGVRRIEAITGYETLNALNTSRKYLAELASIMKVNSSRELAGKLEQNLAAMRDLRSKLEAAMSKELGGEAKRMLTGAHDVGGLKIITAVYDDTSIDIDIDKLRSLESTLRDLEAGIVAVFATVKGDKLTIMTACGKAAVNKGIKAVELIREVTKECGGSGGGKPEFAMGGGGDVSKLTDALGTVYTFVKKKLDE